MIVQESHPSEQMNSFQALKKGLTVQIGSDVRTTTTPKSHCEYLQRSHSPRSPAISRRLHYMSQAEEIIQQARPELFALDLDHTLWPENCFENTCGPYLPCNHINNRTVGCIDPRTKQARVFAMHHEAREIIDWLQSNGLAMTICSRSPDRTVPQGILQALGLWDRFILPQIYRQRKTYHFRNLNDCLGVQYKDILFFDDCEMNVRAVCGLGVVSSVVNPAQGLTWEALVKGLKAFAIAKLERLLQRKCDTTGVVVNLATRSCDSTATTPRLNAYSLESFRHKKQVSFADVSDIDITEARTDEETSSCDDSDTSSVGTGGHIVLLPHSQWRIHSQGSSGNDSISMCSSSSSNSPPSSYCSTPTSRSSSLSTTPLRANAVGVVGIDDCIQQEPHSPLHLLSLAAAACLPASASGSTSTSASSNISGSSSLGKRKVLTNSETQTTMECDDVQHYHKRHSPPPTTSVVVSSPRTSPIASPKAESVIRGYVAEFMR